MTEKEKLEHIKNTFNVDEYGIIISKITGKTMAYQIDKDGYKRFRFWIKRKAYKIALHRLVALLYVPNKNNYPVVNHKDGNKQNNHVSNLEWCTVRHNTLHAQELGLRTFEHSRKKIVQKEINTKKIISVYKSITEAHNVTGIDRQSIGQVVLGRRKSAGGYKWETFND